MLKISLSNQNSDSLPIDSHLEEIVSSFKNHSNLVLTAPPGSGKTTRVPVALLSQFNKIIILVPKRIAAISAAARIADENNWKLGKQVGYQVRFENNTTSESRLIFMTEGIFIKKIQDQRLWNDLELIIFDEFHERSSHLDLALGICLEKQILEQKIKMLIMSATIDIQPLREYLGESNLIQVITKPHSLKIIKSKKSQKLNIDFRFVDLLTSTLYLALTQSKKDILIFLPGLSEIHFIKKQLQEKFKSFEINILHGSIQLEDQKKILQPSPNRRLILATNIAESSLTLPSVDCVIDSGLVKKIVTEAKIGFKKLELSRISLFSAKQRAGRAARLGPGICYQLWHELDERSMPATIQPEILTSDLLAESLTLLSLDINNPEQFSWLDKPKIKFQVAFAQLQKWELIQDLKINTKGSLVQATPLDAERSVIFVELSLRGFQKQASRFMAFLETTNFDKYIENNTSVFDVGQLKLTELGCKIETQLNRITIVPLNFSPQSFKENLISIFFKFLPNKIAKKKEKNFAISSLGRGLELSTYLMNPAAEYFLLLSGREQTNALTKCDYAVAFTAQEFEKYSTKNSRISVDIGFDSEKKKLFKIEKKISGYFVISETAKSYIDEKLYPDIFQNYYTNNFAAILSQHDHYKNYVIKLAFLEKKTTHDFSYLNTFTSDIYNSLANSIHALEEFFTTNLYEILLFSTPKEIKIDLDQLPNFFTLPTGKEIKIDYESEQAPKISARIQEFFGQNTNPTLLNGQLRITIELLAPNYRPAQITSQLENFWKTSYLEIKKELKARYPKHAWPDDPTTYKGLLYFKPTV